MNNTAIAIPSKVTNAVTPPLKKGELIKALAIRKFKQLEEELEQTKKTYQEERSAITDAIRKLALAVDISKVNLDVSKRVIVYHCAGKREVSVPTATFDIQIPADLKKRILANEARRNSTIAGIAPVSEIERQLRAELSGQPSDRVGAILKDEATCKAIDAMLAKIDRRAATNQLADGAVLV